MDTGPDRQYALGQIDREEWLRTRGSRPEPTSASRARSRPVGAVTPNRKLLAVALALIVAASAVLGISWWAYQSSSRALNPNYSEPAFLTPADLASLNASATPGVAFAGNDTLWFPSGPVHLVVYASPPDHDLAFVIHGLVNPTIHVTSGSRISVTVVNMDRDMYHDWALGSHGPPYGSMPMMDSGMMMTMAMLEPASGPGYWSQTASFTAESGSYWYLCDYPGHAASGMYGGLVAGD